MTSKERVWKTIRFEGPDRLAMAAGPHADTVKVSHDLPTAFSPSVPGMDEWGSVWKSLHAELGDQGQVVSYPLEDWSNFAHYRFPDPCAPGRFDRFAQKLAQVDRDKFVIGDLGFGPMHRLEYLLGFENHLMKLLLEPEHIELLLDGIFAYLEGVVCQYAAYGLDGVIFFDDQAMQSGPLFSMDLWRELFAPRYTRLFRLIHEKRMAVYMHTCGNLQWHIPELIRCGVDILDNKQPESWADSQAAQEARGKVTFSTCIDIQKKMQHLTPDEVPEEVDRLVRRLSTPQGGIICTCYAADDLDISPDLTARMLEAMEQFRW